MLKLDSRLQRVWAAVLVLLVASCGGGGGSSSDGGGSSDEVASGPAPIARVDASIDGSILKISPAMIEGEIEQPDAAVMVGGVAATVADGRFSAAVDLNEGANAIALVAQSPAGETTTNVAVTLNTTETCGTGDTFRVDLPGRALPRDPSTEGLSGRTLPDDSVTLPNGCDVYAIIVHGYGRNGDFDELMFYKLAKWVAEHNGYVHWSWWNNLLAEYMARPLHVIPQTSRGDDTYPFPGDITEWGTKRNFMQGGSGKAVPDEDLQFQADVKRVLSAIRANNPDAIVIVAGHSMGGNAVIRLGRQTAVPIDLLAPIDPVGNRNLPEGQGSSFAYITGLKSAVPGTNRYDSGNETFNWTRWRATRDLQGWVDRDCVRTGLGLVCKDFQPLNPLKTEYHCVTVDPTPRNQQPDSDGPIADRACPDWYPATVVRLPAEIRRLYHRWQKETFFPFDWGANYNLAFTTARLYSEQPFDVRYHNYQRGVGRYAESDLPLSGSHPTATKTCEWDTEKDPSGATSFDGVLLDCQDWDGHGEIIGMRATKHRPIAQELPPEPTKENLNPLAATADWKEGKWNRSSPWFPDIGAADPPCSEIDDSACSDTACRAATARRAALVCMATPGDWSFAPKEPDLDLVVNDLVAIADDLWAQRSATPGGEPDVTPPMSTAVLDVEPTIYGWNNTDVTVTITAVDEDGGSGVKEIIYSLSGATTGSDVVAGNTVDLTITDEGTTDIEYFARDNAGNEEAPNTLAINIDETPPTIDGSADPPPNDAGWNNTDVTVTFTADDALSGIDTVTAPVTVTDEGADQKVVGVATDRAGNTASIGVIVNIDKTPPVIGGLPGDCELWPPNHKMVEVADIVISDELSGVAESATDAVSSEPESGRTYGGFAPDVQIDDGVVQLRAERYSLTGRTYDLTVVTTDRADNQAEGSAACTVPHDQGH